MTTENDYQISVLDTDTSFYDLVGRVFKELSDPETPLPTDYNQVLCSLQHIASTRFNEEYNLFPVSMRSSADFIEFAFAVKQAEMNEGPALERYCKDCKKTFYMYREEIEFYKEHNFSLPKRCKEHRKINKENQLLNQKLSGKRYAINLLRGLKNGQVWQNCGHGYYCYRTINIDGEDATVAIFESNFNDIKPFSTKVSAISFELVRYKHIYKAINIQILF